VSLTAGALPYLLNDRRKVHDEIAFCGPVICKIDDGLVFWFQFHDSSSL